MDVQLYLTPIPSAHIEIKDKSVVVIDVLRCTTSIAAALMAGARGVIPTAGPGEAVDLRLELDVTTWRALNDGTLSAPEAFLRRRLRVHGNFVLALKLQLIIG